MQISELELEGGSGTLTFEFGRAKSIYRNGIVPAQALEAIVRIVPHTASVPNEVAVVLCRTILGPNCENKYSR